MKLKARVGFPSRKPLDGTYPEDHEKVRTRTDTGTSAHDVCPPSGKGGTHLGLEVFRES